MNTIFSSCLGEKQQPQIDKLQVINPQPIKFKFIDAIGLTDTILKYFALPRRLEAYSFQRSNLYFLENDTSHVPCLYFPAASPQQSLVIVYCHGSGSTLNNIYDYSYTMSVKYGIAFLAYDYTGDGQSKKQFNNYQSDIKIVLAWIVKLGYKLNRVILCGFSLGSYSALCIEGQMPRILVSPVCGIISFFQTIAARYEGEKYDNISMALKLRTKSIIFHCSEELVHISHGLLLNQALQNDNPFSSIFYEIKDPIYQHKSAPSFLCTIIDKQVECKAQSKWSHFQLQFSDNQKNLIKQIKKHYLYYLSFCNQNIQCKSLPILTKIEVNKLVDIYIVFSVLAMDQGIKNTKPPKQRMVKVQVQLNDEVKIGLIGYKVSDHIFKIYSDLKKIKVIGDEVEPQDIKYYDKDGVVLDQRREFSKYFDPKVEVNVVKIFIPQQFYDYDRATKKSEQFLKNSQIKNKPKQNSQIIVKNLKKSLIYIKDQKYQNIQSHIQNQQLSQAIGLYSQQHKKILAQNNIYIQLIEQIISDTKFIKNDRNLSNVSEEVSKRTSIFIQKYNQLRNALQQAQSNLKYHKQDNNFKSETINAVMQSTTNLQKYYQTKLFEERQYIEAEKIRMKESIQIQLIQQREKFEKMQAHYQRKIKQIQQEADKYYKDQIERLQKQIEQFKNLFKNTEKQSQEYLSELQREKIALKLQYKRTENFCKYFDHIIDHSLILNSVFLNYEFTNQFLQYFKNYCQKLPKNFNIVHKSKNQTITDRFIQQLQSRSNIFLIAKTKQGKIFGGFTSSKVKKSKNNKLRTQKIPNEKSFLFSLERNQINFFPLKGQQSNFQSDNLFISFGAEEISIDRFQLKVESIFVAGDQNQLSYSDVNKKRKFFLSDSEDWSSELEGFQLYQVNTE